MLKLVVSRQTTRTDEMDKAVAIDAAAFASSQFIDELIAQVKYTHLTEVWQARLEELIEDSNSNGSIVKRQFKIL